MGGEFDAFVDTYESDLNRGLALSGESQDYFAKERVKWLAETTSRLCSRPRIILDFGCGAGSAAPLLQKCFAAELVVGVDSSVKSLEVARRRHGGARARFLLPHEWPSGLQADVAYCNGVFHHIDPRERVKNAEFVRRVLKPGGLLGFWENNPWNPGARLVMSRIPFDRDAKMLSASASRALLRQAGFRVLRTDFMFVFPALLRGLRPTERFLRRFPIGAQYLVLATLS